MPTAPQQTEPAEGPRDGEPSSGAPTRSAPAQQEPAEGADDAPAGGTGSPA